MNSRNLYSRTFDKAGLEVVVVQWDQWIELVEDDGSTLPEFKILATCYYSEGSEDSLWTERWEAIFGASCEVGELTPIPTICTDAEVLADNRWIYEWGEFFGATC